MKKYLSFLVIIVLSSCAALDEARIASYQHQCELMGFPLNTEGGKNCVLELEKQFVLGSSMHTPSVSVGSSSANTSINTSANTSANTSTSIPMSTKKDPCMFNSSNNRYETCYHVTAGGSCVHYGSICYP